jgi:hypothetical protein
MNLTARLKKLEQVAEAQIVEATVAEVCARERKRCGEEVSADKRAEMCAQVRDCLHGGPWSKKWDRIEAEPTLERRAEVFLKEFPHEGLSVEAVVEIFEEDAAEEAERRRGREHRATH